MSLMKYTRKRNVRLLPKSVSVKIKCTMFFTVMVGRTRNNSSGRNEEDLYHAPADYLFAMNTKDLESNGNVASLTPGGYMSW